MAAMLFCASDSAFFTRATSLLRDLQERVILPVSRISRAAIIVLTESCSSDVFVRRHVVNGVATRLRQLYSQVVQAVARRTRYPSRSAQRSPLRGWRGSRMRARVRPWSALTTCVAWSALTECAAWSAPTTCSAWSAPTTCAPRGMRGSAGGNLGESSNVWGCRLL